MGYKYIRRYDTRFIDTTNYACSPAVVIPTTAVYDVQTDPHCHNHVLARSDDGVVKIWDWRFPSSQPLLSLTPAQTTPSSLRQVLFSTTQRGMLAALSDTGDISIWETYSRPIDNEPDQLFLMRPRQLKINEPVASFAWVPQTNQILSVASASPGIYLSTIPSPPVIAFGGDTLFHTRSTDIFSTPIYDIAHTMISRITHTPLPQTSSTPSLSPQDSHFAYLPLTLQAWSTHHASLLASSHPDAFRGILESILGNDESYEKMNAQTVPLGSTIGNTYAGAVKQWMKHGEHLHPSRRVALGMCGWGSSEEEFHGILQVFVENGMVLKAAAWALFSGDVKKCVNVLSKGDEKLKLMATVVASYASTYSRRGSISSSSPLSPSSAPLVHDLCRSMSTELHDMYSKAIFAYLSSGVQVLLDASSSPLSLSERVAVAIRWLTNDALAVFLQTNLKQCEETGDLEGLVLCGLGNTSSMIIIQRHLDATADIQTAAILAALCPMHLITTESIFSTLNHWIDTYRDFLNQSHLFHTRCHFDIFRRKRPLPSSSPPIASPSRFTIPPIPPQIYLRCTFCSQSIAHDALLVPGIGIGVFKASQFGKTKQTGCVSCKKPLMRCSVCLGRMGERWVDGGYPVCAHDNTQQQNREGEAGGGGKSGMDAWFTWCQTCRHGGHVKHVEEWFERHDECMVAGCSCRCNKIVT